MLFKNMPRRCSNIKVGEHESLDGSKKNEAELRKNTGRLRDSVVEKNHRSARSDSIREPNTAPSMMNVIDAEVTSEATNIRGSMRGLLMAHAILNDTTLRCFLNCHGSRGATSCENTTVSYSLGSNQPVLWKSVSCVRLVDPLEIQ
jgi:D-aminopeptidase